MDDPKTTVIKIMGLGGGGSNAVNRMIDQGFEGVEFIAANTDAQALAQSHAHRVIRLGEHLTRGLGAGGRPEIGEAAARESEQEIRDALKGADMVFLTAGMGGGTGTGAISVAAEIARSVGALAVAVVSMPFGFEASRRRQNAEAGLVKLRAAADTLITVPNDKLLGLIPRATPLDLALRVADEVLRQGVQGITELISKPGLINMDFANIRVVMKMAGLSMMAIGQGKGEHKAVDAVRQALKMPLLDLRSVSGAAGVLVHFTGGEDLSLVEVSQAANEVTTAAPHADVIFGATIDPGMSGEAQVILVVTGIDNPATEVYRPDSSYHRSDLGTQASRPAPIGAPNVAEQGHLADALFSQAVATKSLEKPWVAADNPVQDVRGSAAVASAQNSLDMPAFLRRRRTLRDLEGGK
jgi:cell division protein FtsZ